MNLVASYSRRTKSVFGKFGKIVLSVLVAGSMLFGDAAVFMKAAPVYAGEIDAADEKTQERKAESLSKKSLSRTAGQRKMP